MVKHAHATRVEVRLEEVEGGLMLVIADDGAGFDRAARHDAEHHGLRNMRARAEEAGGSLQLQSTPGSGTTITVHLPQPG